MPKDGGGKLKKWIYFQNKRGHMVEGKQKQVYIPKSTKGHGGGKTKSLLYAQKKLLSWWRQKENHKICPPAKIVLQFKFRYYIEDTYNTHKYRIITILRDRRR